MMPIPMQMHARMVLGAALLFGVLGDVLLRGGVWRFGFALWIMTLILGALALGGRPTVDRALLLIGLAFAALGLAWRDAPLLYTVDLLSVLCVGALLVWHGSGQRLAHLTVVESVRALALALVNALGGAIGMIERSTTSVDRAPKNNPRTRALVIGTVLAVPPLVIVTSLLVSSDAIFDRILQRVVDFLAAQGLQHVLVALLLTWIVAGLLRGTLGEAIHGPVPQVRSPALPFWSVGVALYALIAVLVLFLATQARVLFGGEAFLMATAGLTLANYAREGFFQMVAAAGVVLGTLVVADWLLGEDNAAGRRRLRLIGAILLVLVSALLASATVRIWLYVNQFGLSVDRLVACAGIALVLAVLLACAATTLRGRSNRFAPATLILTVAWVASLNIVNLEAIVVRANVARAHAGAEFDAAYHAGLSADALPSLLAAAPMLSPADCQLLSVALRKTWTARFADPENGGIDWRSRNLPLVRARAWFDTGPLACRSAVSVLTDRATPQG